MSSVRALSAFLARRPLRVALVAIASVGTASHDVAAQQRREQSDTALARGCREVGEALRAGPKHSSFDYALDVVHLCDQRGPDALAALWQALPDSAHLRARVAARSGTLRDRRMIVVVSSVARNVSRSEDDRLLALTALARYVDSTTVPSVEDLRDASRTLPVTSHASGRSGAEAITSVELLGIFATLTSLSEGDPNAVVKRAASYLLVELASKRP